MTTRKKQRPWFPFSAEELQVALGMYGFLATTLAFMGVQAAQLAWGSMSYAVLFYFAGLLVHARRHAAELMLVRDGGVAGAGFLDPFRSVRRALFLMHLDDDPPCDELLALYRRLLDAGVEIRRTLFLRPEAKPDAFAWVAQFGNHENLQQRIVLPAQASTLPFSFSVIDDHTVILSVPGWEPVDGKPYATRLVLRHLLVIADPAIAAAFLKMHEDTWQAAYQLQDVAELRLLTTDMRLLPPTNEAA